jgi:hypothetical protein
MAILKQATVYPVVASGIRFATPCRAVRRLVPLIFAVCCMLSGEGYGQASRLEQQVKAAFLFKFGGFVEWPADAFAGGDSPFNIGVIGADDLSEELTHIAAGRQVQNRPVAVRRLHAGDGVSDLHVLFIGLPSASQAGDWLGRARQRSVLTVTDANSEFPPGSVINFVTDDKRVRFEISLDTAQSKRLKISASLIAVALRVRN